MRQWTLISLCTLGLAGGLAGQGMGMRTGARGMPLDDDAFPPTIAMLTTMLGLTAEQAAAVAPHRDTLLEQSRADRDAAASLQEALREARATGAGPDSVAALQQRLHSAMLRLMPYRIEFHARVRALVTPEQARLMDQRQQEMLQRMHQGRPGGGN